MDDDEQLYDLSDDDLTQRWAAARSKVTDADVLVVVDELARRLTERRTGFGERLNAEGHTVVALNDHGELTEYRPDGTEVPYEDLDQLMGNLREAIAPIREADQREQDQGPSVEDPSQRHAEEQHLSSAGEDE